MRRLDIQVMNYKRNNNDSAYNLLGVVRTLYRWRRPIIVVSIAAGILTAVISLFLPDYYKSTTIFLAASADQAQPEILFNKSGVRPFVFGSENDIDRLLTIAESSELVNFLVNKFDLYNHYKIDSNQRKAPFKVRKKFFKYYEISKTSKDAIEMSFEDKDPEFAAQVVNAARIKMDAMAQQLVKDRHLKSIGTFEQNIETKINQLNKISDTLINLRSKYQIYNTQSQTESLTSQFDQIHSGFIRNKSRLAALKTTKGIPRDTIRMIEALVTAMSDEKDSLKSRIDLLNQGIPVVNLYEKQFYEANQTLSEDRERLKDIKATYNANIPSILLIEQGAVPIIKSRPRRSILVIAAGFIAFFFSILGVLLFEAYDEIDWKAILTDDQPVKK